MKNRANKHEGMIRGFYHLGGSYYAEANRSMDRVDNVMIGFYTEDGDGGTTGEFAVDWEKLGGKTTPRLKVYDDSWEALSHFLDLIKAMAKVDGEDIEPKKFCAILVELGIKDLTRKELR